MNLSFLRGKKTTSMQPRRQFSEADYYSSDSEDDDLTNNKGSSEEDLETGLSRTSTTEILARSVSQRRSSRLRSRTHSADSLTGKSAFFQHEEEDFDSDEEGSPIKHRETNELDERETKSDNGDEIETKKHRSFLRRSLDRARSSSVNSGKKLGVLDPAFVEDIRASLMEYSRIIKRRRGVGSGLYTVPESTHDWGEKQKSHHVNWGDLFFDVIYVAVAFQLGKLVSDILATRRWEGLWYFYSSFASLYECWSLKLHFSCRFNSSDIFHKIFDIVEFLLVALIAGHLSTTVNEIEDPTNGQLLGFCIFKLAHQLFHMIRWIELWIFGSKKRVARQARSFTIELIIGAVPLTLAVILEFLLFPSTVVIGCLFIATVLQIVHEVLRVFDLGVRKNLEEYAVPMHIEYCVHRYGEWTMLMLGEGVMQIILVQFEQRAERYATFVPAYLLMAALRVLYYSSQPFKAQGHALNQSLKRGFAWLQMQPIESCLIIAVGIGLKEELSKPVLVEKIEYQQYSWFLCVSTALLLVLIWTGSILHQGFQREFVDLPTRIRNLKFFTYAWKFGLSICLVFPPFFHLTSYGVVSTCLFVCILQIITHDVWHRLTKENELDTSYMRSLGLEQAPDPSTFPQRIFRKSQVGDSKESRPKSHPEKEPAEASSSRENGQSRGHHMAPLATFLKQKQRMEDAFRSTFRLGHFKSGHEGENDPSELSRSFNHNFERNQDLQDDLHKLFHKYGERKLLEALNTIISKHVHDDPKPTSKSEKRDEERDLTD